MMGNNGGDDNDTIPFGMSCMSTDDYDFDHYDGDDDDVDYTPMSLFEHPTGHPVHNEHPEYVLIPHAEIIGETNRAIRVTTPICSEPFWLPKSVIIQINNELKVLSWFYRKEIKPNENAEIVSTVVHASGLAANKRLTDSASSKKSKAFMVEQIQKQQPTCPYCGGVGCDCGEDLD